MLKVVKSKNYNYIFNYKDGFFARWGKTKKDDPEFSPFGPEIADIEISTICHGIDKPCDFCYKGNTPKGKYMSLETFKKLFHKLPIKTLTQAAFGIGDIDGNPDMWDIFKYCRKHGIVPNITINGYNMKSDDYDNLVKYCGAVAVSRYNPKDTCYDAVKKLIDKGLKQANIHMLLAKETYEDCHELLYDYEHDERLKGLNAIVFLLLKPKGKRNKYHVIKDRDKYKSLIDRALAKNIPIGFDSCFAPIFLDCVRDHKDYKKYEMIAEPCESGLFSSYINVKGEYYSCSFIEGEKGYNGINILECDDFMKDLWYNKEVKKWRHNLIQSKDKNNCRRCPHFNLYESLDNV